MTDEEIDAMEAGQRLDLLIAEKVMGWRNLEWRKGKNDGRSFSPEGYYGEGPDGACYLTRRYSTHLPDAWQVVEKMRQLGLAHQFGEAFENTTPWQWYLIKTGYFCLDICRAALKAIAAI